MTVAEPLAFFGGRVCPQSEARLPLNDAGFVWGATVTDLCRTIRQELYCWEDHLQRFIESCRAVGIDLPLSRIEISEFAEELVENNCRLLGLEDDLALVLIATPGPIGYYLGETGGVGMDPTFSMHTFPLPFYRYRKYHEQGAKLVIPSTRAVPIDCVPPQIKQRSRLHWWLAEQEARQTDADASALLLNHQGHITETAAANFLMVKNGIVFCPDQRDVLPGVSQKVVEELCHELNIPFVHRSLTVADAVNADEAMLTCTSFCLAGVSKINGKALHWPGKIFEQLLDHWSAKIGLDIQRQIMGD